MSGPTDNRTTQVISFPSSATAESLEFEKINEFVLSARRLDQSLQQERERAKKLQEEVMQIHSTYGRLLQEANAKAEELATREQRARAALTPYQEHDKQIRERFQQLLEQYKKTRAELEQYRSAWSEVLQREREAKLIIAESRALQAETAKQKEALAKTQAELATETEKKQQLERHVQGYQKELQASLLRIHSAEARLNELSKELQVAQQRKKNFEEEIDKVEQSMRERFQFELIRERERMRADLERDAALEREKFREEHRQGLQRELESAMVNERAKLVQARMEFDRERSKLSGEAKAADDRAQGLKEKLTLLENHLTALGKENSALKKSLAETDRARIMAEDLARDLQASVDRSRERAESIAQAFAAERISKDATLARMSLEIQSLRGNHPIKSYLAALDFEIMKLQGEISELSGPALLSERHDELMDAIEILFDQRDALREVARSLDQRLESFMRLVQAHENRDTLMAQAPALEH